MRGVTLLPFATILLASLVAHGVEQPELAATEVVRDAGLVVLRGRLDNGEEIDLCTLGKISVERSGAVEVGKDGGKIGGGSKKAWSEAAEREFDQCVQDASACVVLGNTCEFFASKRAAKRLVGVAVAVDARGADSLAPRDLQAVQSWQAKMLDSQAKVLAKLDGQTLELGRLADEAKRVADQFEKQTRAMDGLAAAVKVLVEAPGKMCERAVADESAALRGELVALRKENGELQTRIEQLSSSAAANSASP